MTATIVVTGVAGFIGFHLATHLIQKDHLVVGLDNMNNYYDPQLKEDRLNMLLGSNRFKFHRVDLKDKYSVDSIFAKYKPDYVINLAAQAGVRYSITNPLLSPLIDLDK